MNKRERERERSVADPNAVQGKGGFLLWFVWLFSYGAEAGDPRGAERCMEMGTGPQRTCRLIQVGNEAASAKLAKAGGEE